MAAAVEFNVTHRFTQTSRTVWDEMIDWKGHERWIPMTGVEVGPEPLGEIGATFTASTGVGPFAVDDRMRVTRLDWDDDTSIGECRVEKLGPVLVGTAGFTVEPAGVGSRVVWIEDVEVRYLPRVAAPVATRLGAAGFSRAMKRLAELLDRA